MVLQTLAIYQSIPAINNATRAIKDKSRCGSYRFNYVRYEVARERGRSEMFLSFVHVKQPPTLPARFSDSRRTKERASYRAIKLNSSIPWEFHDESNRNSRFPPKKEKKIEQRDEKRKKRKGEIK